jgi:hypothetical protein
MEKKPTVTLSAQLMESIVTSLDHIADSMEGKAPFSLLTDMAPPEQIRCISALLADKLRQARQA